MQFFVNGSPVCGDTVPLGVQGENLATQITADVSGWLDQWPDGQVIVRLIDANRQSHLADTVVDDGTLVWIVTAADTAQGGYGVGVIELVQGDVVKKSEPFATRVITDPQASGQAPEPVPGWVEETIARMEELEASAAQSADAAQTSAQSAQTSAQNAQTGAQSAQAAADQAAQSAEDAAAVLPQVETAGAAQVTAIQAAGQQQTQAVTAAGAQQVSAVQTEGADQRAAIETAGAAQVNAVQAEGQTQQTAIEQKGADTLASIPADYTELSGEVTELKSEINENIPYEFYSYVKGELRTGSLQPNTAVGSETNSFALKAKIPLTAGKTAVITPTLHNDMAKWGCRVVAYTNPEMTTSIPGTIKVNNFNISSSTESISYTQASGFSYILVGIYYYNENGENYANVSAQFEDDETIIFISQNDTRKKLVYQEEYQETVNEVDTLSADMSDAKGSLYLYSPISFTASAGARGGSVYSEQTFYHVDLPVVAGEKYHVKTATTYATVNAINAYKDGYTSMSTICGGTASGFVDEYVTIPDGYTIMTVNSSHRYGVTIEKYMGLKDAEENIYPSYFQNEIDDTVEKTRGFCEEKALVFAVMTDSHLNANYGTQVWDDTAENIKRFNSEYQIDGIVHLGDMINGTDTKAISTSELDHIRNSLKDITGVKNASYLMGNHDTNTFYGSSMDDPITEAEMYSDMFRQNAVGIIRPDGKLYGYRDFDSYGIRVIYLNASGGDGTHGGRGANWKYTDDELTWVRDVALDTNYQVLFFSHMPMTEGTISSSSTLPTNGNALKAIVSDFVDNGGVVIGLIYGHTHYDYMYNNGKFYEVSIGCEDYTYTATEAHPTASYAPQTAVIPARMRYTVTQDLWDVVIVRPVSKTVKLVRFGAGSDRAFAY